MKETNVIEQPVMGSSELTQALDNSQNDLSRNLWPWLVVWLGFEPMTTHLAGQHCSKWANQVGFLGHDRVWVILHTIEPESHFPFVCFYHILTSSVIYNNGEFKMSLWRGKWEREKVIGSGKQNNNLHVHHAFLYYSWPSLHDYDMNWTISHFIDNVNVWGRIPLSLFKLEYLS